MSNFDESNPLLPKEDQELEATKDEKKSTAESGGAPPPAAVSIGWTTDGLPVGEVTMHRSQSESGIFACLGRTDESCSSDLEVYPDAEVIALSPNTLMTKNRFICEICNKGFQRDQNLQLHRRGHDLPMKLKQRVKKDQVKKKVYICPEKTCVHHDPTRALGDLDVVKRHFRRKHGEKKWKCEKCSKRYAVQSDWEAHSKACETREYKCECGTLFSRRGDFIAHRAFCDALSEESSRISQLNNLAERFSNSLEIPHLNPSFLGNISAGNSLMDHHQQNPTLPVWLDLRKNTQMINNPIERSSNLYTPSSNSTPFPHQINVSSTMKEAYADKIMDLSSSTDVLMNLDSGLHGVDQNSLTRDFLDLGGGGGGRRPSVLPARSDKIWLR